MIRGVIFMQLPIIDASEEGLPPEDVRIRKVAIDVFGDRRRARVSIELTPFQIPPDIAVMISDRDGQELASTNIIGLMNRKMTFTMHLPETDSSNSCLLHTAVEYQEQGRVHEVKTAFSLSNKTAVEEA
jgi:hypothetical protein